MKPKSNPKLTYRFHNPNTAEETAKALIKLAAELAMSRVTTELLHIEPETRAVSE
jgi:hypothetical protein